MKNLSADIFCQHYYNKKDLIKFCQQVGISTYGLKKEIENRIVLYLRTQIIEKISIKKSNMVMSDSQQGLKLDKIVVHYKSDLVTRNFFKKYIPEFTGFSAYVQRWLKKRLLNDEILTYADVIEEHKKFLEEKKRKKISGERKIVIHESCQFNQFYIDYNYCLQKKNHSAKESWYLVRNTSGEKTYERYMREFNILKEEN
jgi:hypothetical protein